MTHLGRLMFLIVAALLSVGAGPGRKMAYVQAQDRIPVELAQPGSQVVVQNCSGCHSLDYIAKQPRGKGTQFWHDEVTKMVIVYKAPISPADAEGIAAELAKKFG